LERRAEKPIGIKVGVATQHPSLATCAERHQFSVNDNYHNRHRSSNKNNIINKNDNNSHNIFSIHINSNVDDNGVSAMSTRAATAKATF
jgi:hypothetical protein